jgi:hypothetical protein
VARRLQFDRDMHHDKIGALVVPAALFLAALSSGCAVRDDAARGPITTPTPNFESENTWTPQSPLEKWWERATACPPGTALVGDVPPKGYTLECRSPDGKRNGRSSVWFESGHSGTYTEYENDVPHGRWIYWLDNQLLVEGHFERGRRQGNWTYWFDGRSGFDMRARWAERNVRNYTVESYDRGLLVKTTRYRDGVPAE